MDVVPSMNVYDAVESRRAVRAFADTPVSKDVLRRVLAAAARSPSGGNIQPWNTYVLTGESLVKLKRLTAKRLSEGDRGDEREFEMYPSNLKSPYCERQSATAEQRYRQLGVRLDDPQARQAAIAANWNCFGAPAALFIFIDRDMGLAQWADIGMYMQTVMLLLRAEGLHSCPQMAWSVYHKTVAGVLRPPAELMLFCGMSIGFEDSARGYVRTDRAPLADTVKFLD